MTADIASESLRDLVAAALDDGKADDIRVLDVRELTTITDYMIVASGRSARQVKALKDRVLEAAREHGARPLGVEGESAGEWVLIDFGDVIVHTMRPETREHYQLEKLWERANAPSPAAESAVDS